MAVWLSADTLGLNNGDTVANWPDQSVGVVHDAVQGNTSLQPVLIENAVNGLPVV